MADFVQEYTNHLMATLFDPNHHCKYCDEELD
jgi:hypothetical protein